VTSLELTFDQPATLDLDAVVVGVYSADGAPLPAPGAESVDAALDGRLVDVLTRLGATGSAAEVTKLATLGATTAPVVVAVGLGARPDTDSTDTAPAVGIDGTATVAHNVIRRAAGAAIRALAGTARVGLALPLVAPGERPVLRAAAEGALLGAYEAPSFKSAPAEGRREPVETVTLVLPDIDREVAEAELERARIVTDAVRTTRDWVNTPANNLRPAAFADQIAAVATAAGLAVEVLDEQALAAAGYGGLLAVGGGSASPPRLVRLSHTPPDNPDAALIALVGKGITFDTGGISIKPAQGMWDMKTDMAGAAAVAATMIAAARLHSPVRLVGYLAIAENMPSGTAYRPGDVVTMYGGRTVEVLNTDAEGRLVLGDAIARACEDSPAALLETSTLTGGQIIALGNSVSGLMGTPDLLEEVKAAGERSGEAMWPMPLPEDIRTSMDSTIADSLQVASGMERAGHMLQGGVFVSGFMTDGLRWAHIDIAGPSTASSATGHLTKGATGVPVRTFLEFLDGFADTAG
jgi:leucyl aminopeptidase